MNVIGRVVFGVLVIATLGLVPRGGVDTDLRAGFDRYVRPASTPYPDNNQYSPARELLGRTLFFDPRLSASQVTSCASCHNPGLSWGDGLPKGVGHGQKQLGRRTPTVLDVAWGASFFWDGRAETLEEQALGPIASPAEMNLPLDSVVARLRRVQGYQRMFIDAYGKEGISPVTIGKALATYERTVVSGVAPFDRWVAGDERAVSEDAKRGFQLFTGKARCAQCHVGWRFTDDGFYDIGIRGTDRGRAAIVPGVEILENAFKAPTLRNADQRAPYMHDGSEANLEDVVAFYDRGGDERRPSLSPEMRALHLTAGERAQVVAFLRTLTSVDAPVTIPVLPR